MPKSQVKIISEYSEAMQRVMPFAVILPQGYESNTRRYPTLYYLHGGFYGSFMDFLDMANIVEFTSDKEVIVVLVHGNGSWYANPYHGGRYGPPYWETYHIHELIPMVDALFRTSASREGRAVGGSSKGGYGALCYAARYPHLFSSVSASSAPVDGPRDGLHPTILQSHGRIDENEIFYLGHRPKELAINLQGLDIYFSLGDGTYTDDDLERDQGIVEVGVQLEKDFLAENEKFHHVLADLGYPHHFEIISPGYHSWHYFERQYKDQLLFHLESFSDPPLKPLHWSFRTIEDKFSIWDWHFEVSRGEKEFLFMRNVCVTGFEIYGSGELHVKTDSSYLPGEPYIICNEIKGSKKVIKEKRCMADRDGSLHFQITLEDKIETLKQSTVGVASQFDESESHIIRILPCS
jgi:S-formylglutathione hydrolase FrmB